MRPKSLLLAAALPMLIAGCGAAPPAPPPVRPPCEPAPKVARAASALDDRPVLAAPKAFEPPAPQVFKLASGLTVWLVERHTLPVVSAAIAIDSGSAADPVDMPGLSYITADMLDEGAGKRSAIEVSNAINDLGATLSIGNTTEGSYASLSVLKKNFAPAFEVLADVVARPRFEAKDMTRVAGLWKDGLKKRADDPAAVTSVVWAAALYGQASPYGHPSNGLLRGAEAANLAAVKRFYRDAWRPDHAVLIVVGDVTKDEIEALTKSALGDWKAPRTKSAPPRASSAPPRQRPKLVVVDRADAPQAVIAVVRDGVSASDPAAAPLDLVNTALGGSFTSRLNQNLREDHGWTYGARSGFTEVRGKGAFIARASVQTEATGPALKEMLAELEKMAKGGLSAEEVEKVRAQDSADLVQTYETVDSIAQRLASLAMLGRPPSFDLQASKARQAASQADLAALAQAHVDPSSAIIVVVGPSAEVLPQLKELGLGEPEMWDKEGSPLPPPKP